MVVEVRGVAFKLKVGKIKSSQTSRLTLVSTHFSALLSSRIQYNEIEKNVQISDCTISALPIPVSDHGPNKVCSKVPEKTQFMVSCLVT